MPYIRTLCPHALPPFPALFYRGEVFASELYTCTEDLAARLAIYITRTRPSTMRNLTDPRALWMKGGLFVVLGLVAAAILIARSPSFSSAALLAITVWAFCRAYYFAFYVIEHYVDPSYRFAGLIDFLRYALGAKTPDRVTRSDET